MRLGRLLVAMFLLVTSFTLIGALRTATGSVSTTRGAGVGSGPDDCNLRALVRPLGSGRLAYAALVRTRAPAFRRPGGRFVGTFRRLNVNGVPTVLGVRGVVRSPRCGGAWYRVQLPVRPNGTSGYVRARDVVLAPVRTRIVVELGRRRLTLFRDGRPLMRARVAVGSASTPTPPGRFYVSQRLLARDPTGPYGPGALGISAFSNVLLTWRQGGPIAIHGTNEPSTIGRAVSDGCIRLPNRTLSLVFRRTLPGTPVLIRP